LLHELLAGLEGKGEEGGWQEIRIWHLGRRSDKELSDLVWDINSQV